MNWKMSEGAGMVTVSVLRKIANVEDFCFSVVDLRFEHNGEPAMCKTQVKLLEVC